MMNNENGRSMVEMLGVLAIIGVLSVAGIAGYTMAMKKYRTNEILNTASQLVILAKAKNAGNGGTAYLNEFGENYKVAGLTSMQADCTSGSCHVSGQANANTVTGGAWDAAAAAVGSDDFYSFS